MAENYIREPEEREADIFAARWCSSPEDSAWHPFLRLWAERFRTYPTGLSFLEGLHYESIPWRELDRDYTCIIPRGKFELRHQLMKLQPRYRPQTALTTRMLGRVCSAQCLLCDALLRSVDLRSTARSEIMLELGHYLVLPNRYPAHPGASLLLPLEHRGYVTAEDLRVLLEVCDKFDLVGSRNHPLAGASIPGHSHYHLAPRMLPCFSLFDSLEHLRTGWIEEVPQELSPFSTLSISHGSADWLAATAWSVIEALQRAGRVFTFVYSRQRFVITPRLGLGFGRPLAVGAGISYHSIDANDLALTRSINRFVPRSGTFEWGKFIRSVDFSVH